jgi:hypothetical protein
MKKIFTVKNAKSLLLVSLSMLFLGSCITPELATLGGVVTDRDTGEPVSGATVSVVNKNNLSVITAADGLYKFVEIGAGKYTLEVSHPDYETSPSKDAVVNVDDATCDMQITMKRFTFTGTVKDSRTNESVSGVSVNVIFSAGSETATTNQNGIYIFNNLKRGSLLISFSKAGYKNKTAEVTLPDVNNLTTLLDPLSTLAGTVTDAQTGVALSGVTVTLNPGDHSLTTGADGAYMFTGLNQTSYTLAASLSGYQTFSQNITVNLSIPANTQDIQLSPNTKTLSGTVTNSSGSALSGVTVTLNPGNLTSTTTGSGTYTFTGLTGTSYQISASKSGYDSYGPSTVSTPNTSNTYNFQMTATTKTLSGTVTNSSGSALSGVTVTLNPGNLTTTTTGSGIYTFTGLTGTSYQISASRSGYNTYGPYAIPTPNTYNTYNFQMTATQPVIKTLSGTVTSSSGGVLSGVSITLNPGGYTYTTGTSGTYSFSGLTGTSYQIYASRSGYNDFGPSTVSTPNTSNTYNFQMTATQPATKTLSGTVTSSSGGVLSDVTVTLNPGNLTTTTISNGTYSFSGLTGTSWQISASKSGYNNFGPATVSTPNTSNTYNLQMTPNNTPGQGKVTVSSSLSISDGIYTEFSFDSYTSQYIAAMYYTSYASSLSDDAIIALLQSDGIIRPIINSYLYYYNMAASTSYTLCAVAIDTQGRYGMLTRQTFSTKSSSNQPRAVLTISKSGSRINVTVTRNSYCSYYKLWLGSLSEYDSSNPDIIYANLAYTNGDTEFVNYLSDLGFTYNSSYPYSCAITLGYTSSGVQSGVIDVKVISNSSGTVVRSAQVDLRSLSKDEIKQMESGRINGKFVKSLMKIEKE